MGCGCSSDASSQGARGNDDADGGQLAEGAAPWRHAVQLARQPPARVQRNVRRGAADADGEAAAAGAVEPRASAYACYRGQWAPSAVGGFSAVALRPRDVHPDPLAALSDDYSDADHDDDDDDG